MDETVYVCTGTCGAIIDQKRYDEGLTACGADVCTLKGHPFEKRKKCNICGALYKENEPHSH